jgi:hypothetical protein
MSTEHHLLFSEKQAGAAHGQDADAVAMRFLDELRGLEHFGRGIARGAGKRAEELTELIIHPDETLCEGMREFGEALHSANDYYRDTPASKVTDDAASAVSAFGKMLEDYGRKSPEEQGAVCGGLALDVLLAEVAAFGIAKSTLAVNDSAMTAVSMQSRTDREFQRALETLKLGSKTEYGSLLQSLIDSLPSRIQDFIATHKIEVIPVSTMSIIEPDCIGAAGMFTVREGKPYIFIAEDMHYVDGIFNAQRLALTLRHEAAHAIDFLSSKTGWLSDAPRLQALFDREFAALHKTHQKFLLETIGNFSKRTVRREVVAELVSRRAVPTGSILDQYFADAFPDLDRALHAPGSPFSTH